MQLMLTPFLLRGGDIVIGLKDNIFLSFGKYGPGAERKPVSMIPNSYLRWCLEEDWFERKHPELVNVFQEELSWRSLWGVKIEE